MREIEHLKRNCTIDDEKEIAKVVKPDGTEFIKMLCNNCGKIWLGFYQDEGLIVG